MGICKPYLYEAADKRALTYPSSRDYQCKLECPYEANFSALPPEKDCDFQPKKEIACKPTSSKTPTCSKEPAISYKTSSGTPLNYRHPDPFVVNVSAHPPRPMTVFNSTMKDSYPPHSVHDTARTVVPTVKEFTGCRINRVGLDCEPPFPCEERGYVTDLDFMLPTSAKDFRRFRPDELPNDAPVTIYTERGDYIPRVGCAPTTASCRRAPLRNWDKIRTKKRLDTYVPPKPQLIPHNGMCSETQAKFQHRTDELFVESLFPAVKFPICVHPYRSEEIFLCPGMYIPESAHYGSRIPVGTFIDIDKNKNDVHFQFCTTKKKTVKPR